MVQRDGHLTPLSEAKIRGGGDVGAQIELGFSAAEVRVGEQVRERAKERFGVATEQGGEDGMDASGAEDVVGYQPGGIGVEAELIEHLEDPGGHGVVLTEEREGQVDFDHERTRFRGGKPPAFGEGGKKEGLAALPEQEGGGPERMEPFRRHEIA